ncbi:MAG: hypothetical protein AAF773_11735 [Cyanobacteria bacterium P01_D01_bin.115]
MAAKSAEQLHDRPRHPREQRPPERPSNGGVRSEVTAGLANVLTHQIQQTAGLIDDAEKFTDKAARTLAQKAHGLASGQMFSQKFVSELNALCEAQPYDGYESLDWGEAEAVLERLGKPSLPPAKPNFLPAA